MTTTTTFDSPAQPFTDYSRWRLLISDGGRHTWHYLNSDEECEKWPQTLCDKFWLGLPMDLPDLPQPQTPMEAARNGYSFYKNLQAHDGHWPGEYGGPLFLLPGFVIGSYVTGMSFRPEQKLEMIRYIMNRAHPDNGGWGLHVEGPSSAFGTATNYVALRLLGMATDHPVCVRARATLHKLGGAAACPSWGKFWLSVLNVYDWEGNNPIPPELYLLPDWLSFHPTKWWVHVRAVFAPMAYLYGIRFQAHEDDLILALRQELYTEDYDSIYWPAQRNNVCKVDLYSPHTAVFDFANVVLGMYESCGLPPLRKAALDCVYSHIVQEDENTGYQTIGPVSKMMNLMVRAVVDGPESYAYKEHSRKREDFLWMCHEGLMVTGTNGSQLWDTGFITQALAETGLANLQENREDVVKALEWLDQAQMQENRKHPRYRHPTKGAWGFSTTEQGYTVSDCTAEGLKSVLYLQNLEFTPKLVSKERLQDAVDVLLPMQNPNGGFASYEFIKGAWWLEWLNPSEVFGNIMIDYCYTECTTSVITALSIFKKNYPDYRSREIDRTIKHAIDFVHSVQTHEGGWVGSWGICFTYASMFALESLSLAGETYQNSSSARRGCEFLLGKQRADGGWGESYESCEQSKWIEHAETQVVQTAWAVIALMYAQYPHPEPIERATRLVMSRQKLDGSWAQEAIEGVFNKTCAIAYPNFKFSFPIWMLAKAHLYLESLRVKSIVYN